MDRPTKRSSGNRLSATGVAGLLAALLGLGSSVLGAPLGKAHPLELETPGLQRTEPPAAAKEADLKAIASVLGRYATAMEAKDLTGLKAVWPALGETQERKVRASFERTRSIRVQMDGIDVRIDGSSAVANCRRRDQIVTIEGLSFQSDRKATVRLVKKAGAWTIESIE